MRRRNRVLVMAATALAVAAPAAEGATKTVRMGAPPDALQRLERLMADANAFFPASVRVRAGDTVSFVPAGFHSVDLPPPGRSPLPLIGPTGPVSGVVDAGGAPFWFNGLPLLGFDARLVRRSGFGRSFVRGSGRILSGLPLGPRLKPMKVRFPRAGVHRYYCNVHPGMRGTVRVVARRGAVPSRRADARGVRRQAARAVSVARRLGRDTDSPDRTVRVGADGPGGVHVFAFFPRRLEVAAGTVVKFSMPARSTEAHTASFGPGDPIADPERDPGNYLAPISKTFQGAPAIDPRATYPSEPPGSPPAALTPLLHGNGFWNSGVLDGAPSPLPRSGSVRFAAPGTYRYYCLIHPFMRGTIVAR